MVSALSSTVPAGTGARLSPSPCGRGSGGWGGSWSAAPWAPPPPARGGGEQRIHHHRLRGQHFQHRPTQQRERARPWVIRAHLPVQERRVAGPVDPAVLAHQLRGVSHSGLGLRHRLRRLRQGTHDQPPTQLGQHVVQRGGGGLRADRHRLAQQHRTGIQASVHLHDRDARLGIAREHRGLDRRRPAPPRQQAGMDVQAPAPRRVQHGGRQDQAVGSDHRPIQVQFSEGGLSLGIGAQAPRRPNGNAQRIGRHMHRAAPHRLSAPGGPGRLTVHRGDLVPRCMQRPQRRHREVGAAHEGEADRLSCHGRACRGHPRFDSGWRVARTRAIRARITGLTKRILSAARHTLPVMAGRVPATHASTVMRGWPGHARP